MTAAAQLEAAVSGHLNPHRNEGGKSAKPAADPPPQCVQFSFVIDMALRQRERAHAGPRGTAV